MLNFKSTGSDKVIEKAREFLKIAITSIDQELGADYARKNPALLSKFLDVIISKRMVDKVKSAG